MKLSFLQHLLTKNARMLIALLWLISTLIFIKLFGIVTNLEAEKYIGEAEEFIKNGSLSAPRFWFYSVTIFIIVLALKLKIGLIGAFIIQGLLNLFAYLFFYNEIKKIFKIPLTAFFIVTYLMLFWPYQSWIVYLFTESAFYSLILILIGVLIRYKPDNFKNISIISIALLLVIISRPLGILFTSGVYIYFFYCANKKWKIILGFLSLLFLIVGFYVVNIIFSTISDWYITKPFEQESVICDLPNANPTNTKLNLNTTGNPVYQLFYYVTHNFIHFKHFAGVKIQYFFLMTRPYYSKAHNYFVLVNTIALYILVMIGFFVKRYQIDKKITAFLLSVIAIYTVTIIFQCDDYHNRFILSIFPMFVILAAGTVEFIVLSLKRN